MSKARGSRGNPTLFGPGTDLDLDKAVTERSTTLRRRLRPAIALLAASGMFLALAACGGGGDEGGGGDAPTGGATGEASGEVTWWGWTPDTPVAQKYIAEFNKVHPNIT